MQLLKKRILQDGKCYEGGILKVDGFINHQMDPVLMKSIGVEFVRRFAATNVNKIMTIEASGIAPAIMTGYLMDLPVVFAKKKSPKTIQNALSTVILFDILEVAVSTHLQFIAGNLITNDDAYKKE